MVLLVTSSNTPPVPSHAHVLPRSPEEKQPEEKEAQHKVEGAQEGPFHLGGGELERGSMLATLDSSMDGHVKQRVFDKTAVGCRPNIHASRDTMPLHALAIQHARST